MKDMGIIDAYINLASAIILQCEKDIADWERQRPFREKRVRLNNGCYVTEQQLKSAKRFLQSDVCEYLRHMIIDWKRLYDNANKENM